MLDKFAATGIDSHPNKSFAAKVAPLFSQRIIDVSENRGDISKSAGEKN